MTPGMFPDISNFKFPEFKVTGKNAYEIRSDILALAKDLVLEDFRYKYSGWEISAERDTSTGQVITSVSMPEFPGIEKVLETAQKMYDFVNQCNKK